MDRICFTLAVRRSRTGFCQFLLSGDSLNSIEVEIPYDQALERYLIKWQSSYVYYCESVPNRGRSAGSGGGIPSNESLRLDLSAKESELLIRFYEWLDNGKLQVIKRKITELAKPIRIHLCCEDPFEKLPWESAKLGLDGNADIQIVRTAVNIIKDPAIRSIDGNRRILAIAGDNKGISFEKEREILETFKPTPIFFGNWGKNNIENDLNDPIEKIKSLLEDEKGWDMLFFAGHSNENDSLGGELLLNEKGLTLKNIEASLEKAHQNGLQFILFNSCSGLSFANKLIQMGFHQVLIMRERIHDSVAQTFFEEFAKILNQGKNVYEATEETRNKIQDMSVEYPSAYLIPSLFCNPKAELFSLKPLKIWRRISAQRMGLTALIVILSLFPLTQLFILDIEQMIVSLFRGLLPPAKSPELVIVHIDQDSLDADQRTKGVNPNPINKDYLAGVIRQLTKKQVKSIAVDYLLDKPSDNNSDAVLSQAIQDAQSQNIGLMFASVGELGIHSNSKINLSHPTVAGDITLPGFHGSFPDHIILKNTQTKDDIPFYYFLAMMQEKMPFKTMDGWLENTVKDSHVVSSTTIQPWFTSLSIDYSRSPEDIYNRISSKQLLQESEHFDLANKVILIAPGGYKEASINPRQEGEDNYSLPLPIRLRSSFGLKNDRGLEYFANNRPFTGSEIHAYIANQLLTKSVIIRIPDLLLILISFAAGSCIIKIYDRKNVYHKAALASSIFIYVASCLGIYCSVNVAIPFILPSLTIYFVYILPLYRNKKYAYTE